MRWEQAACYHQFGERLCISAFSASLGDIKELTSALTHNLTRAVRGLGAIPKSFPESVLEGTDELRQWRPARECSTERMTDLGYRIDRMFAASSTKVHAYMTPSLRRTHEAFAQSRRRNISMVELMALYWWYKCNTRPRTPANYLSHFPHHSHFCNVGRSSDELTNQHLALNVTTITYRMPIRQRLGSSITSLAHERASDNCRVSPVDLE